MYTPTTNSFSSTTLLFSFLGSAVTAQLLGCDAVKCPVNEYRTAQCEIGNATLKAIGIVNVTTSLDAGPLTWTLGLQELKANGTKPTFDRNFYLGTPPSLELSDTTGCALFFEGVSANLTVPHEDQLDRFTCSDTMAESCVSDLIAQAQSTFEKLQDVSSEYPDVCSRLRDSLTKDPPSSCHGVKGSWGTVIARNLTGDSVPTHLSQTQCRPTTGQDYDLALIASSRKEAASREWSELAPILNAITPVMTIFSKGNESKAELSCLKLVESQANQTQDTPQTQNSAPLPNFPTLLYMLPMAIMYAIFQ